MDCAVSLESHNEAYNNILKTIIDLEKSGKFDKISLYNRDSELLAFKESESSVDLSHIYGKQRGQLSEKEIAALLSQINWVICRRLERNASVKEIEAAKQLRDDLKN